MANVLEGTFTSATQSAAYRPSGGAPATWERGSGYFNFTLFGTFSATVEMQRSFDAGVTWHTVSQDATGLAASYTQPVSLVVLEPENGVQYRLACTAHASGTVNYRLSR